MTAASPHAMVLGIHPTSRGFGWILFESPLGPHDWGNVFVRSGDKNLHCLTYIERLLDRYEPRVIVLESFDKQRSARAARIAKLGRAILALAGDRSIEVAIYSRGEVKAAFASVGASSRQQVAEAIARHLPALRHRLPKPRKVWDSERPRMALFCAAALCLTHYRFEAAQLMSDLKRQAEDGD